MNDERKMTETVFLVFAENPNNVMSRLPNGDTQGTHLRMWECLGAPPEDEVNDEMEAIAYVANALKRPGRYLAVSGEAFTVGMGITEPENLKRQREEAMSNRLLEQENATMAEKIERLERELGIGDKEEGTTTDDEDADDVA